MTGAIPGGVGLEYLSVFGMGLPDYVAMAGRLECDFVSVNFGQAANPIGEPVGETLRESASMRQELARLLAAHGLRLEQVEGFAITREISARDYAADLDTVAGLGARSVCAVSLDKDMERTNAQFAMLAEMADARDLVVTTEVGAGVVRNFEIARDCLHAVAHANFALLIDTMHFFRSGATVRDLDAIPLDAVRHVQLCDVPMPAQIDSYMEEALFERRCPGDGDLPLGEFLLRLPANVPIGLEVPIRSELQAGIDAEARLRRCLARTKALLA